MKQLLSKLSPLSLIGIFLFIAEPVLAQKQEPSPHPVIINTDLVVTWAQVTNRADGSPVNGLGIQDFALREEGKQQQINLVKEGQPLSVVILVDGMTCVSEPERWYRRREEILRQLGDDAEIALMAWDSDAVLVQPLTTDHSVITEKLSDKLNFFYALNPGPYGIEPYFGTEIKVRPERTHYRPGEAIYQAARYLEKAASSGRRKIVIVVSRSELKLASTHIHKSSEVKAVLNRTGTTVYGLVHDEKYRRFGEKLYDRIGTPLSEIRGLLGGTLNQFVNLTGGVTLTGEWEECDELFIKLARMIRSSYTIGYYPENSDFDGRFRRISLELSRQGKTKAGKVAIKTRDGYYALRPAHPADTGMRR